MSTPGEHKYGPLDEGTIVDEPAPNDKTRVGLEGRGMVPGRRRRWHVADFGMFVIARYVIDDQTPDEDVTDDPPTVRLTRDEWLRRHAEFAMTADFRPLS